jgi:hypothetical protein
VRPYLKKLWGYDAELPSKHETLSLSLSSEPCQKRKKDHKEQIPMSQDPLIIDQPGSFVSKLE